MSVRAVDVKVKKSECHRSCISLVRASLLSTRFLRARYADICRSHSAPMQWVSMMTWRRESVTGGYSRVTCGSTAGTTVISSSSLCGQLRPHHHRGLSSDSVAVGPSLHDQAWIDLYGPFLLDWAMGGTEEISEAPYQQRRRLGLPGCQSGCFSSRFAIKHNVSPRALWRFFARSNLPMGVPTSRRICCAWMFYYKTPGVHHASDAAAGQC